MYYQLRRSIFSVEGVGAGYIQSRENALMESPERPRYLYGLREFELVWDRRGAGKTYGRSGPVGPEIIITLGRIAERSESSK